MVDPIDTLPRSHSLIRYSQIRQRYVRMVSPAIYVDITCGRLEEIEVVFFSADGTPRKKFRMFRSSFHLICEDAFKQFHQKRSTLRGVRKLDPKVLGSVKIRFKLLNLRVHIA